jgi:DNA-binding transcriptional regulator YhcF (GntR family)
MTELTPEAQAVVDAFDVEYYQKARNRYYALSAVLRELVGQLKYIGITEKNILKLADELEENLK